MPVTWIKFDNVDDSATTASGQIYDGSTASAIPKTLMYDVHYINSPAEPTLDYLDIGEITEKMKKEAREKKKIEKWRRNMRSL